VLALVGDDLSGVSIMSIATIAARAQGPVLSVLRIVAAGLMMFHGTQKLFGIPAATPPRPPAELFSLMGLAGIIETFVAGALLVGLASRPAALLLSGQMAVAYFKAHAPRDLLPLLNQGELAALYSFVFLYLSVAGPGPWSLDRLLSKGSDAATQPPRTPPQPPSRHQRTWSPWRDHRPARATRESPGSPASRPSPPGDDRGQSPPR
jgi:putative oxidoreductase